MSKSEYFGDPEYLAAILKAILDIEEDYTASYNGLMLRADFAHALIKWGGLKGTARERREQARRLARVATEAVRL